MEESRGVALVIYGLTTILALIPLSEAYFAYRRWRALSDQINEWAENNAWLARGLTTVIFVLLAHFVLNPI